MYTALNILFSNFHTVKLTFFSVLIPAQVDIITPKIRVQDSSPPKIPTSDSFTLSVSPLHITPGNPWWDVDHSTSVFSRLLHNEIMEPMTLKACLLSLSITSLRLIQDIARISNSSFLLLGNISLCDYITICVAFHLLKDVWVLFSFG